MPYLAAGALGSFGPKAQSAREALRAAANDSALRDEAEWALSRIDGVGSGKPVAVSHLVPALSVAPPLRTTGVKTSNPPVDWNTTTGRNIVWSVELGNETFGRPVVAGDAVYVGTDNARRMNPLGVFSSMPRSPSPARARAALLKRKDLLFSNLQTH